MTKKRWKKIHMTKDLKILLEYQVMSPRKKWDDHVFQCSDAPLESFLAAFKALAEHVVDMCELPLGDLAESRITVKGATFSYGGDRETMGAVLVAARKLKFSGSPLNLVTPHKPCEPYGKGQDESLNGLLDPDCVEALKALAREAERYLKGERAQVDMFEETENELAAVAAY